MRVKVCGLRDGANIREVEALHPDMMGFICWAGSKRYVGAEPPSYLPATEGPVRVGVFVDPTMGEVEAYTRSLGLRRIQLHGNESPEFCQEVGDILGLPVTKALGISEAEDLSKCEPYERVRAVDLFLFDTPSPASPGGNGRKFDWGALSAYHGPTPFVLAGGIGLGDEERVLSLAHPRLWGVDLNSRFETAPGVKDIERLRTFIDNIKNGKPHQPTLQA